MIKNYLSLVILLLFIIKIQNIKQMLIVPYYIKLLFLVFFILIWLIYCWYTGYKNGSTLKYMTALIKYLVFIHTIIELIISHSIVNENVIILFLLINDFVSILYKEYENLKIFLLKLKEDVFNHEKIINLLHKGIKEKEINKKIIHYFFMSNGHQLYTLKVFYNVNYYNKFIEELVIKISNYFLK